MRRRDGERHRRQQLTASQDSLAELRRAIGLKKSEKREWGEVCREVWDGKKKNLKERKGG